MTTMDTSLQGTYAGGAARRGMQRGYTLIEILVVVALIGIILVIAIPNMRRARVRAHMLEQVRSLRQGVALGRINAIRAGTPVVLGLAAGTGTVFRLWEDPNGNEAYDSGERIVWERHLAGDITIAEDTTRGLRTLTDGSKGVVFRRDGVVLASAAGDAGYGAVTLTDRNSNVVRISIASGTGTVVVEMPDGSGGWTTDMKHWRY